MAVKLNFGSVWGGFIQSATKAKIPSDFGTNLQNLATNNKLTKLNTLMLIQEEVDKLKDHPRISTTHKIFAINELNRHLGFKEQVLENGISSTVEIFQKNLTDRIKTVQDSKIEEIEKLMHQAAEEILHEQAMELEEKMIDPQHSTEINEANKKIIKNVFKEVKKLLMSHHVKKFEDLTEEQQEMIKNNHRKNIQSVDFLLKDTDGNSKETIMAFVWVTVLMLTGVRLNKDKNVAYLKMVEEGASKQQIDDYNKRQTKLCKLWNYFNKWMPYKQEILALPSCRHALRQKKELSITAHYSVYLGSILEKHPDKKERALAILAPLNPGSSTYQSYINSENNSPFADIENKIKQEFGISFKYLKDTKEKFPAWVQSALPSKGL